MGKDTPAKVDSVTDIRLKNPKEYAYARELVRMKSVLLLEMMDEGGAEDRLTVEVLTLFVDSAINNSMSPFHYENQKRQEERKRSGGKGTQGGSDSVDGASGSPPKDRRPPGMDQALEECDRWNKEYQERYGPNAPLVMPDLAKHPVGVLLTCSAKNEKTGEPCGSQVWDNRPKIESGEFDKDASHFKCKDKQCKKAVWPKPKGK